MRRINPKSMKSPGGPPKEVPPKEMKMASVLNMTMALPGESTSTSLVSTKGSTSRRVTPSKSEKKVVAVSPTLSHHRSTPQRLQPISHSNVDHVKGALQNDKPVKKMDPIPSLPVASRSRSGGIHNREAEDIAAKKQTISPTKSSKGQSKIKNVKTLSNKPVLPDIAAKMSTVENLLLGYIHGVPPPSSSIVRIFLSSTFSDYKEERNRLFNRTYPKLQQYCSALGLDFQVVDLRWGINEEAANDHSVEEICLAEIEQCQRLSKGVTFVAMLGNRYGYRPVPSSIEAAEFECLWRIAERDKIEGCSLLTSWYQKDDNNVPPVYTIQPINSKFPHYLDFDPQNENLRKEAVMKWSNVISKLQKVLRHSVRRAVEEKMLNDGAADKYILSVTESEVEKGLMDDNLRADRTLCFARELSGLYDDLSNDMVKRFGNIQKCADTGDPILNHECNELQKTFIGKIKSKLPDNNIIHYSIPWSESGVSSSTQQSHEDYLNSFCDDLESNVKRLVEKWHEDEKKTIEKDCMVVLASKNDMNKMSNSEKPSKPKRKEGNMMTNLDFILGHESLKATVNDLNNVSQLATISPKLNRIKPALFSDIRHHLNFCKTKCQLFCGRTKELKEVQGFLKISSKNVPLIVHAPSGGGKTAFMAKVSEKSHDWLGADAVSIVRFLGTSRSSSSLRQVLLSVCHHIAIAYNLTYPEGRLTKMRKIIQYLDELMMQVSIKFMSSRPLVIILDSADQLDTSDDAHKMSWLPKATPAGVYFMVSVLPDVHNSLQNAREHLKENGKFLKLDMMPGNVAQEYAGVYLASRRRTLSEDQMVHLLGKLKENTHPLLMTLVLDQACSWKSHEQVSELQLALTVQEAIVKLFEKLEKKFCDLFIETALGYLTVSGSGITEVDLEDALSCSDDVLNTVYKYHNPPVEGVIRIPSLMWARTRTDLLHYIVERQSHGRTTVYWYHRQFTEAALNRYCCPEKAQRLHAGLADIYLTVNGVKRTITLDHRNMTIEDADRMVTPKALTSSNKHLLVMLLYHLKRSKDVDRMKKETYFNFEFLICFIKAFSLSELLQDLKEYLETEKDSDLKLLHDCLQFSQAHIKGTTGSLGCQLLGQLRCYAASSPVIELLCSQARLAMSQSERSGLIPIAGSMPSSSSALKWYTTNVTRVLSQSPDSNHALLETSRITKDSPSVTLFNMSSLTRGQNLQVDQEKVVKCCMSNDNKKVFVLCSEFFYVFSFSSGECLQSHTTDINHSGHLNMCLAISSDDQYLSLGGPERLAMLENKSSTTDESEFKVRRAMNLTGASHCSNLLFLGDDSMTISTHTIKSQKKIIGAVVLWDIWNKQLKSRVALPTAVESGFLYKLPRLAQHDLALCGCQNGIIFTVDVTEGKIINQMGQQVKYSSPILSCFDFHSHLLITAVKHQSKLEIWNADVSSSDLISLATTASPITDFAYSSDMNVVVVGDDNGFLSVYQINRECSKILGHFQAHTGSVLSVICDDKEQVLTTGTDGFMKVWGVEGLVEPTESTSPLVKSHYQGLDAELQVNDFTIRGQELLTGTETGIRSWSLGDTTECTNEYNHTECTNLVCQDDLVACTAGDTQNLVVYESTGQCVTVEELQGLSVSSVYMSSHTAHLAFCIVFKGSTSYLYELDLKKKKVSNKLPLDISRSNTKICTTLSNDKRIIILSYDKKKTEKSLGLVSNNLHCVDLENKTSTTCLYFNSKSLNPAKNPQSVFSFAKLDEETILIGCRGDVMSWQPAKSDECELVVKEGMKTWLRHSVRMYWKTNKPGGPIDPIPVTALLISEDKKAIVSGAETGTVMWWRNVPKSEAMDVSHNVLLSGHNSEIMTLAFNPSGSLLFSGSRDHSIRLWSIPDGTLLCTVFCHMNVNRIALSEKYLITLCTNMDSRRVLVYERHEKDDKRQSQRCK